MSRQGLTVRRRVWNKTGGRCWYCGIQTVIQPHHTLSGRDDTFTVEHLIPLLKTCRMKAGLWTKSVHLRLISLDNLVPCCRKCNVTKGAREAALANRIIQDGANARLLLPMPD
jgi:5-methylcytosine-specific restriction endonuclease McrA